MLTVGISVFVLICVSVKAVNGIFVYLVEIGWGNKHGLLKKLS